MPMSHKIPSVSSDSKILARTSHECRTVSPEINRIEPVHAIVPFYRTFQEMI